VFRVDALGFDETSRNCSIENAGEGSRVLEKLLLCQSLRIDNRNAARHGASVRQNRALTLIDIVEVLLDDPKRQIVIALNGEHKTQPVDICGRVRAVSGRGATRRDELPVFEESEFRR